MEINNFIDHTILAPDAMLGKYTDGVRDCLKYNFYGYCVNSAFVPLVSHLLKGYKCNSKLVSTVGFPFGSSCIDSKLIEINQGIKEGASEFDVVAALYSIKSQDWDHLNKELIQLRSASDGHILKLILEVGLLNDYEVQRTCQLAIENNYNFVKTSTGFLAKLEPQQTARYVKLMSDCVRGTGVLVKASGGIRSLDSVKMMIEAGASRVGTSNSVAIMEELNG